MVGELETKLSDDLLLERLQRFIMKLDDRVTAGADEVVVMLPRELRLVTDLLRVKSMR